MGLSICVAGCCPGCGICCGVGAGCHADPCTCAKPPPVRVQQRREKGWRKPEGAVSVTRSTRFGNSYKVDRCAMTPAKQGRDGLWGYPRTGPYEVYQVDKRGYATGLRWGGFGDDKLAATRFAVDLHRRSWLAATTGVDGSWRLNVLIGELGGRDLMCFCPLWTPDGDRHPCHADTLLRLANPDVSFPWAA